GEARAEGRLVQAGAPRNGNPAGLEALLGASPVSVEREAGLPGGEFPELDVSGLAAQPASRDPVPAGLWRTVTLDTFGAPVAAEVPRVPGLPVLTWRVQPGEPGQDVNAVDQLLENGQIIRTISGPADRVAPLVAEEAEQTGGDRAEVPSDRMTVTVRQGERMLAITGPAHVLGSLLQRVSGPRRY
ncbi:MAG TPA: hypothetical protein VNJ71_03730, partial [Gemmatimonadales bacterium]|nr:hypothetical protein [Gemmatimonadales bacterium]